MENSAFLGGVIQIVKNSAAVKCVLPSRTSCLKVVLATLSNNYYTTCNKAFSSEIQSMNSDVLMFYMKYEWKRLLLVAFIIAERVTFEWVPLNCRAYKAVEHSTGFQIFCHKWITACVFAFFEDVRTSCVFVSCKRVTHKVIYKEASFVYETICLFSQNKKQRSKFSGLFDSLWLFSHILFPSDHINCCTNGITVSFTWFFKHNCKT